MKKSTYWLAGSLAALALLGAMTAAAGDRVTPSQIATATTSAQHEAIAQAYEDEAAASEKRAESHATMAQTYRMGPNKSSGASMGNHCGRLEETYRSAAAEYRMLAKEHREMAAAAK